MIAIISDYAPEMATANRHSAASAKIAGADQIRNKTILMRLLQAVAYGTFACCRCLLRAAWSI